MVCRSGALAMGIGAILICGIVRQTTATEPGKGRTMEISVSVDRGRDVGQSFGSLFEVPTADGACVLGAGFADVYNTNARIDRHAIQFFVRPTDGSRQFAIEPMPRPSTVAGTYLYDYDG